MSVLLVGTLDTKGAELQFVRDLLHQAGVGTLVLDAGVMGPPYFTADVPRECVFAAAGTSLEKSNAPAIAAGPSKRQRAGPWFAL